MKFRKVSLGPDWIDLSFGEPKVVMSSLYNQLNRVGSQFKLPVMRDLAKWEYQPAAGNPEFINLLEKKYDAKVVACNGAKQAIAAGLYALRSASRKNIHFETPYYPANCGLANLAGLPICSSSSDADSLLIATPNNPDGKNYSNLELIYLSNNRPTIHDAAYYTEIYLPEGQLPIGIGDMQIFSFSKMYGLSGLRIGYIVCHNEKYYDDVVNFVELNTAGVSAVSQDIALNIEIFFRDNPAYYKEFVRDARQSIADNRKLLSQLNSDVLTILDCQSNSMFAWCKKGPKLDLQKAKVHALDGTLFGTDESYIRLNIAVPCEILKVAIHRLNDENM